MYPICDLPFLSSLSICSIRYIIRQARKGWLPVARLFSSRAARRAASGAPPSLPTSAPHLPGSGSARPCVSAGIAGLTTTPRRQQCSLPRVPPTRLHRLRLCPPPRVAPDAPCGRAQGRAGRDVARVVPQRGRQGCQGARADRRAGQQRGRGRNGGCSGRGRRE